MNRPYSEATLDLAARAIHAVRTETQDRPERAAELWEYPVYRKAARASAEAALDAIAPVLLPEGAETRTEWTAPAEPGSEVTAVTDKHGRRWGRHAGLWCHTDDQLRHTHLYWDELFFSFPLTNATPVDAVRLAEGSKAFQDPSVSVEETPQ